MRERTIFLALAIVVAGGSVAAPNAAKAADALDLVAGKVWQFEQDTYRFETQRIVFGEAPGTVTGIAIFNAADEPVGAALDNPVFTRPVVLIQAPTTARQYLVDEASSTQLTGTFRELAEPIAWPGAPAAGGLLGYWAFNITSKNLVSDSLGLRLGEVRGSAFLVDGVSPAAGRALLFDGTGIVDLDTAASLDGQTDFAVSAFVRPEEYRQDATVISQRDEQGFDGEYWLRLGGAGRPEFAVFGDGQFQARVRADGQLPRGQWAHLVGVRQGTRVSLYVDGVLVAEAEGDFVAPLDGTLQTSIGADLRNTGNEFLGAIDEVRIYSRALSAAEVAQLNDVRHGNTPAPAQGTVNGAVTGSFEATSELNPNRQLELALPVNSALSCPGFYIGRVDATGHSGYWSLAIELRGERRLMQGGINFGGGFSSLPGFAGFNITNRQNEPQRVIAEGTVEHFDGAYQVEFVRRSGSAATVVASQMFTGGDFELAAVLEPGFYTARILSVNGSPSEIGVFNISMSTSFVDRAGGGFFGGANVGGMLSMDVVDGNTGFAAVCIDQQQQVDFQTSGAPDFNGTGVQDLALAVLDRNRLVIARDPSVPAN